MQKLICFSALTAVTQTCLVIHLFLSHKSTCVWPSEIFRADDRSCKAPQLLRRSIDDVVPAQLR